MKYLQYCYLLLRCIDGVVVCKVLYRRITDFHYLENREAKVQKQCVSVILSQ